jgi:hypothetical protein
MHSSQPEIFKFESNDFSIKNANVIEEKQDFCFSFDFFVVYSYQMIG